ncbi:MAG: VWA domain-containing protein [Lewinellaceae bacterium]|nr:VWA domain-containing protein [Saprospiraceae bacterium]MCB9338704.1 VWA domain-containing protein [Lewinellaceae bacterium]
MKQFLLLHSLAMLLAFSIQTNAQTNTLFILDGSGSMWQKLDNEFRIATAKTVMKGLVDKMPADARAGLIAYGHNRKSDCDDIETLMPLGPLDKTAFKAKLEAINPQGKTPIAKSIQHALDLIKHEQSAVTVVLVSDGLETCEGDACELVRQARAQGVQITVHVVGFGIEENDLSALECIAQAGGGQYFPANNASELAGALDQTLEETPQNGGYLSIKATLDGEPLDASLKVFKKGEKKETAVARTYTGPLTNPRLLLLPAGEYRAEVMAIRIDGSPTQVLADLKITENDTLRKLVDFSQGIFEVLAKRNGELSDVTVQVFPAGEKKAVAAGRTYRHAKSNPASYKVVPGVYDVELKFIEIAGDPILRFENQVLESGKTISLSHDHPSAELKIGAKQGASLVDAGVAIFSKTTGKEVDRGRTYMSDRSNPKSFIVEPGLYKIEVKAIKPADLGTKTFELEVKAKETVERWGEW